MKKVFILLFSIGFLIFSKGDTFAQSEPSVLIEPDFQEVQVGNDFVVEVLINAKGQIVGADVRISFDQEILDVVEIDDGDIFNELILKSIEQGSIKITGLAENNEKFSGLGRFAVVHFNAKDAGNAKLKVEFEAGSTVDSNLSSVQVKDTLQKVDEGTFLSGSMFERGTATARRTFMRILPFFIFLIFLGIAGFFGYRWWKEQQQKPKNVFVQESVPMDRPPQGEPPVPPTG